MNDEAISAYPLSWPTGWAKPRTPAGERKRAKFGKASRQNYDQTWTNRRTLSVNDATGFLLAELRRLGGTNPIISTNIRLRIDGLPYSNQAEPADTGASVFFTLEGTARSFACDTFDRVADNINAIGKKIENIREDDRYGVGTLDQAFAGYLQLPAQTVRPWWEVLGFSKEQSSLAAVKEAYRAHAKLYHPDADGGGIPELWEELKRAYEMGLKAVGA